MPERNNKINTPRQTGLKVNFWFINKFFTIIFVI